MNSNINNWRLNGNLSIWKYKYSNRSYKGFHIAISKTAAGSLQNLIDLFLNTTGKLYKTIELRTPAKADISATGCKSPAQKFRKLKLSICSDEVDQYQTSTVEDYLIIQISRSNLSTVMQALGRIRSGEDDFCIHPSNVKRDYLEQSIWFWLCGEGSKNL